MILETPHVPLSPADSAALARAVEALERTSFATRLTGVLGRQIEAIGAFAPAPLAALVSRASTLAITAAMQAALASLGKAKQRDSKTLHKVLAVASGAAGGAFGFVSLPFELPISTTIMLRSIADIARAEGEDLAAPEAALACLEVFALGGPNKDATVRESAYFALRGALAQSVTEAAAYLAQRTAADESAPILVRLMGMIAGRFGVVVSQKTAAQAAPVIGAVAGAAINLAFTEHFQGLAKGHFTVRRLERKYAPDVVRAEYEKMAAVRGRSG